MQLDRIAMTSHLGPTNIFIGFMEQYPLAHIKGPIGTFCVFVTKIKAGTLYQSLNTLNPAFTWGK